MSTKLRSFREIDVSSLRTNPNHGISEIPDGEIRHRLEGLSFGGKAFRSSTSLLENIDLWFASPMLDFCEKKTVQFQQRQRPTDQEALNGRTAVRCYPNELLICFHTFSGNFHTQPLAKFDHRFDDLAR